VTTIVTGDVSYSMLETYLGLLRPQPTS
jgi:hypothetical protein